MLLKGKNTHTQVDFSLKKKKNSKQHTRLKINQRTNQEANLLFQSIFFLEHMRGVENWPC